MDLPQQFVLNVNDEEAARYVVTRILQREGFWVREAATGAEALAMAREGAALVVLDVKLPDLSGLEVCRILKSDSATASIPVLQTSATFISSERKIEGLESGADGYLAQPLEPLELVATVNALLRAREAEDALRQAAQDWQRTFDALGDAVAVASGGGRLLRMNPAMRKLLRLGPDDHLDTAAERLEELLPGRLRSAAAGLGRQGHLSGEVQHRDRHYRYVLDPIPSPSPNAERWVVVVSDRTGQWILQEEQRRRAQELSEDARRKDEFLAMLAHELRNPLHAISTALQLQERIGSRDEASVKLRGGLRRQVSHLSRLVDDLLDVSRMTRGKVTLERRRANLVEILEHAVGVVRSQADERAQTIAVQLAETGVLVNVDPVRIEQGLTNVLMNAVRYSPPETRIDVELSTQGDQGVRISVRDQGRGIEAHRLESVFELFEQADQSLARSEGGLGIGLTVARSLIEFHDGRIWAESDGLGHGSRFVIELPRLVDTAESLAVEVKHSDGQAPRLRIALIEDNRDAATALGALLEDLGHAVDIAYDGPAGLNLIQSQAPDVALVDIGLPGMDGYRLVESLDASVYRPYLIAVSGYGQPRDVERARASGFDAHLVKPVDLDNLQELLANRSNRAPDAAQKTRGDGLRIE